MALNTSPSPKNMAATIVKYKWPLFFPDSFNFPFDPHKNSSPNIIFTVVDDSSRTTEKNCFVSNTSKYTVRLTVKLCYGLQEKVCLRYGTTSSRGVKMVLYVEQVDQPLRLPRSNGWLYMGQRGVTYRRQTVFGTGFRVRIAVPSPGPGHKGSR